MAKRGRPRGRTSWWQNPVNVAAHRLAFMIEAWLAHQPVRRFTVPAKTKKRLCDMAIEETAALYPGLPTPTAEQVLAVYNRQRAPIASGPSLIRRRRERGSSSGC